MYTWIKEASMLKVGIWEGKLLALVFQISGDKAYECHEFDNTPTGEKDFENHCE
jgi:hypothetical protein